MYENCQPCQFNTVLISHFFATREIVRLSIAGSPIDRSTHYFHKAGCGEVEYRKVKQNLVLDEFSGVYELYV